MFWVRWERDLSPWTLFPGQTAMPRTARASAANLCYHVLNRGNNRARVFHKDGDFDAFVDLLAEAKLRIPMRILGYCMLPNHFHPALWPLGDGDLGRWMHWLLTAHFRRYQRHYRSTGHVWQGRFKAFPTMLKSASSAPRGGTNKRGRTHPVYHPDLVPPNLDLLDQRTDDFPPFLPARPGQAGLNALGEILQTL